MDEATIIGMLGAAIMAMWGFIIYLFKATLNRADRRIDQLEQREDATLAALVKSVDAMGNVVGAATEALKELRGAFEDLRRNSGWAGGGRP